MNDPETCYAKDNKESQYHLDVLDSLFEMKREGLIHSVLTKNFPPSLLQSAMACGFSVHSNEVVGNLLNTENLNPNSELGVICSDGLSRLVSSPLGGGLFTKEFRQCKDLGQLSASRGKKFSYLMSTFCKMGDKAGLDDTQKWKEYRACMDTLDEMAFKYQASAESIALRWLLQLHGGDSVSVGTRLGMDMAEEQGGEPYSRHRNLRQVFAFSIEEEDMEQMCELSGYNADPRAADADQIDFTNRALWI